MIDQDKIQPIAEETAKATLGGALCELAFERTDEPSRDRNGVRRVRF
jgi:hypothetical protein